MLCGGCRFILLLTSSARRAPTAFQLNNSALDWLNRMSLTELSLSA
jgi:hypothetical protein